MPEGPRPTARAPRILVVDDDPANLAVLQGCLESEGYRVQAARDGATALALAARSAPDAVLLDVVMPGMDGFEVCRCLKQDPDLAHTPVLFITARDEPAARLEAFRAGAVDVVAKPFEASEVRARTRVHVELARLRAELALRNAELERRVAEVTEAKERLEREAERRRSAEAGRQRAEARASALARREAEQWGVEAIVGDSPAMRAVIDELDALRDSDVPVLVTGESGTGKELVARALHLGSPRADAPFVALNCAAIPGELAESTLFGHVRGAFSGAEDDRPGYFAAADGGTLFLDEVGSMPPALQPKLLRALEEGRITAVGDTREVPVDVRVVSATNADPARQITAGALRSDLYFRLARFTLALPPLRSRRGDVKLLAEHFLRRFAVEMGRPEPVLDRSARAALARYPFPGNVRELRNMMEHALLRGRDGVVTVRHIHFMGWEAGEGYGAAAAGQEAGALVGADGSHATRATVRGDPPDAPAPEPDPKARILAFVRRTGEVVNADVRSLLGVSARRASYLLGRLEDDGRLEQLGSRRWTRYRLQDGERNGEEDARL